MASSGSSRFLPLFTALVLLLQFNPNTAAPFIPYTWYYESFCSGNYSAGSTYKRNLDTLLSPISNDVPHNKSYFYSNTVGTSSDQISGIFQCRGDLSPEVCRNCTETATLDVKLGSRPDCQNKMEATIFYNHCWLRYANKIILSTMISDPKSHKEGDLVANPDQFGKTLNELMTRLVAKALSTSSDIMYYASGEENVTSLQTIYGAQCTQDISRRDCGRCLANSLKQILSCCSAKESGRHLKPSCILWFDVTKFYESAPLKARQAKSSTRIVLPTVLAFVLSIIVIFLYLRRKKSLETVKDLDEIPTVESLQLNFATVNTATNNFDDTNKLGEGGFGAVYKGILLDGRKIAVKRLSQNSGQGVQEFKNEVLLLAKLRHRNLVKLLGFCLEGKEKLLIYEYVPNRSLERFIFGPVREGYLDWERRYNIIHGIARGLLYLHEDSHDRIIHRDLKAANILLDAQMNPKIADFGLARIFVVDQMEANTRRIVGTHGYMPPEYLLQGHFSVKLDVFSFGVLVLEIITGQRNNSFHPAGLDQDLLSYAWREWKEGNAEELLDPTIREDYSKDEVMKCIQMGLLCVQKDTGKRPTMAAVVIMLNNYSFTLPAPSKPAFFPESATEVNVINEDDGMYTTDRSQSIVRDQSISDSVNDVSITELSAR